MTRLRQIYLEPEMPDDYNVHLADAMSTELFPFCATNMHSGVTASWRRSNAPSARKNSSDSLQALVWFGSRDTKSR